MTVNSRCACALLQSVRKIFCVIEVGWKKVCVWESVLLCVTVSVVLYPCWQSSSYHSTNPERVARVGVVPDCRQAHYLSLAKKTPHYTKKNTQNERAFICCLTLREFPLLFT